MNSACPCMARFPSINVNFMLVSMAFAWMELGRGWRGLQWWCGQNLLSLNPRSAHFTPMTLSIALKASRQTCSPWAVGCAACVLFPSLEKSLQLGKGYLDLYFWARNPLLPSIPFFWKEQLFFCFDGSPRKLCVGTAGRSLVIVRRSPFEGAAQVLTRILGRGGANRGIGPQQGLCCGFPPQLCSSNSKDKAERVLVP